MLSFICALISSFFLTISITTSNLASLFSHPAGPFWQEVLDKERSFFHLVPPSYQAHRLNCLGVVSGSNQRCKKYVAKCVGWVHTLRMALVETDPTDPSLGPMLRQYASLWFCHQHWDPDRAFVQNLLKRWEGELKQAFTAERLWPLIKPRPLQNAVMPGSFLDHDYDVNVDVDVVDHDVDDNGLEQAFTARRLSPLFTPPPQGHPVMPGSFLDDDYLVDFDNSEPIQSNDPQEVNEISGMDGAVSPPVTPPTANADDGHSRPSSRRKRLGQGQPTAKWRFIPYNLRPAGDILHTVIISQLKESELASGHIYILQRPEDSKYLKIGYTTQEPDARLEEWRRSCLSPYLRLYATEPITNVKRVESLIHADLRPVRYSESRCKGNPACKVQHTEWFKVSLEKAKAVVDHWAQWMRALEPYENENGLLKAKYVLQMFREDDGADSDGDGIASLFLNDSDGNSWVEHAQVLKEPKKDDSPLPSHHNQSAVKPPQGSTSNEGQPQLPCTPTPAYLTPDSRTSSSSTTTSVFSTVSTSSSASEMTVTPADIGSHRRSSKPMRRRLFHNAPKSPTLPEPSSPNYDMDVDVDEAVGDQQTPLKVSSRGKKKRYPDLQSSKPGRAISSPEIPIPALLLSRGKDSRVSFAPASNASGRIPKFKRAATTDATGTGPAPSPSPSTLQPYLLTIKARELAARGYPHRRAVSSPAFLVQQQQQQDQHSGVDEGVRAKVATDEGHWGDGVDDRRRRDKSTGNHAISHGYLSKAHASGNGSDESGSSDNDEDDEEDSEVDDSDVSAEEETESDSEGDSVDSDMASDTASDTGSGGDEGYTTEDDPDDDGTDTNSDGDATNSDGDATNSDGDATNSDDDYDRYGEY